MKKNERSLEEEIELYQRLTRNHPHAAERMLKKISALSDPKTHLTPMERRILLFLSHGLTVQMTADTLGKSYHTIWSQVRGARVALGAKNTAHAVAIALRRGIIE